MDEFLKFYNKNKKQLFNYLLRMTGDYELAKDIMQESFTRLIEHYRAKALSASLIYTIARNALYDHMRRQKHQTDINKLEAGEQSPDLEHTMMIRQEYRRVISAMSRLKNTEREIIALVTGGDLSYKDIAAITGLSVANVKINVHRARLRLREILKEG